MQIQTVEAEPVEYLNIFLNLETIQNWSLIQLQHISLSGYINKMLMHYVYPRLTQ